MAVKTFVGEDIVKIDEEVNAFMKSKGRNCPVRTEGFLVSDSSNVWKIVHKSTVFYDDPTFVGNQGQRMTEAVNQASDSFFPSGNTPTPTKKTDKIGALWVRGTKTSGKLNESNFELTEEIKNSLEHTTTKSGDDMMVGNINGVDVRILKNKFKVEEKHPDFVILAK
jgi:hypothetical protein|tara:strand:+ start:7267 stop:7767 length:501 start_codon:yes stop_codon:yes gene_type:complete